MLPVQRDLRERDNRPRPEQATATGDNERARVRRRNTTVSADTVLPPNPQRRPAVSRQQVFEQFWEPVTAPAPARLNRSSGRAGQDSVQLAGLGQLAGLPAIWTGGKTLQSNSQTFFLSTKREDGADTRI